MNRIFHLILGFLHLTIWLSPTKFTIEAIKRGSWNCVLHSMTLTLLTQSREQVSAAQQLTRSFTLDEYIHEVLKRFALHILRDALTDHAILNIPIFCSLRAPTVTAEKKGHTRFVFRACLFCFVEAG